MHRLKTLLAIAAGGLFFAGSGVATAQAVQCPVPGQCTTLSGFKTLDICSVPETSPAQYTYSGVITVWNSGAVDTVGLTITDWIQSKQGKGAFTDKISCNVTYSGEIPANTDEFSAEAFPYTCTGPLLAGDIRNSATVTIMNHAGSYGTPKGPNPKATWTGVILPCGQNNGGGHCSLTQGYWKNHPSKQPANWSTNAPDWPVGYLPGDLFFTSGFTWQEILDEPVGGLAYVNLAHQYIAATLNVANGSTVPGSIATILASATSYFNGTLLPVPDDATLVTWAGTLDQYNKGLYPQGPIHCEGTPTE